MIGSGTLLLPASSALSSHFLHDEFKHSLCSFWNLFEETIISSWRTDTHTSRNYLSLVLRIIVDGLLMHQQLETLPRNVRMKLLEWTCYEAWTARGLQLTLRLLYNIK